MTKLALFALAVVPAMLAYAPVPGGTTNPRQINKLSWLAGCWRQSSSRAVIDEQWMAPNGGMMMGAGRTVRGDSVSEYEAVRIFERGETVIYHAEPSQQQPADFTSIELTDSTVVFENPTHDYPQRVFYRKRGRDSLIAGISGTMNGKSRVIPFPYARVDCTK